MPNSSRLHREKTRKKTRYSSDSDSEREKSRKYHEKSHSKTKDRRSRERSKKSSSRHRERRKRYSSSSSSSSSRSSRSSSSSSRDKKASNSKQRSLSSKKAEKVAFDHVKTFEIDDLYKEEDKVKILDSLEAETFKQETFQSRKKIVVDLQKDKILVPSESFAADGQEDEPLIHPSFLGDEEAKVEKWIKKLHLYRSQ